MTKNDLIEFGKRLKEYFLQIADAVKSVNGNTPDANGDVSVEKVDFATDLESSSTQYSEDAYIDRTSGGAASIKDGDAWLVSVRGNAVHTGKITEVLDLQVVSEEADPITATIDPATFKAEVTQDATITLTYTTEWSESPATYGVTVTGTPVNGDQIVITYVKEELGEITVSNPSKFVATGWNLFNYNNGNGYARVKKYHPDYGFRIEGAYTAVQFSPTFDGERQSVTVTNGNFNIPEDGYLFVTGGNSSTTAVFMTWSDWTEGYKWDGEQEGAFSAYSESVIDLSSLFGENKPFPYGLLAVGSVRDEINLNNGQAISRVERLAYSAENLTTAQQSGREYDYDEDYIYLARAAAVTTTISISRDYQVADHGMEIFDSDVPVVAQSIYGASLKNKLERDVLTISQQTLTQQQKRQVQENIGANGVPRFETYNSYSQVFESLASGVTITQCYANRYGAIVYLNLEFKINRAITVTSVGNITNINLGVLKEEFRPVSTRGMNLLGFDSNDKPEVVCYSDLKTLVLGALRATGSERTIPANTMMACAGTYISGIVKTD